MTKVTQVRSADNGVPDVADTLLMDLVLAHLGGELMKKMGPLVFNYTGFQLHAL